jgi:fructoselysine 6-kinase
MNDTNAPLVAIGDNCLDVYLSKDIQTVGGNALNVAAHWRMAGHAARYFGAVGTDPEAAVVLEELAIAGLSPTDVEVRAGDTAVTLLRDRLGDRSFLLEAFGVGENFVPSPHADAAIADARWVHLGTNANPDLVRRLSAALVQGRSS